MKQGISIPCLGAVTATTCARSLLDHKASFVPHCRAQRRVSQLQLRSSPDVVVLFSHWTWMNSRSIAQQQRPTAPIKVQARLSVKRERCWFPTDVPFFFLPAAVLTTKRCLPTYSLRQHLPLLPPLFAPAATPLEHRLPSPTFLCPMLEGVNKKRRGSRRGGRVAKASERIGKGRKSEGVLPEQTRRRRPTKANEEGEKPEGAEGGGLAGVNGEGGGSQGAAGANGEGRGSQGAARANGEEGESQREG